ncbi:MAG: ribosome maturation factor RimM [Lapillicoccus sp.]
MDVVVARIGRPHGLLGEVTVQTHTDEPATRFAPGTAYATEAIPGTGVPRSLTLRSSRLHNGVWLLAFEEVPDRTGAESLRGTRLVMDNGIDPAAAAAAVLTSAASGASGSSGASGASGASAASVTEQTEPGEAWYEEELIGLVVVLTDGSRVGEVSALEIGAAQDLLVVTLDGGHTAYVPFVSAIVPTVDIEGGRVVIDPPPGLLELGT